MKRVKTGGVGYQTGLRKWHLDALDGLDMAELMRNLPIVVVMDTHPIPKALQTDYTQHSNNLERLWQ